MLGYTIEKDDRVRNGEQCPAETSIGNRSAANGHSDSKSALLRYLRVLWVCVDLTVWPHMSWLWSVSQVVRAKCSYSLNMSVYYYYFKQPPRNDHVEIDCPGCFHCILILMTSQGCCSITSLLIGFKLKCNHLILNCTHLCHCSVIKIILLQWKHYTEVQSLNKSE